MQNPPKKKVLDQAQNPPKKLLDQVRDAIRLKHYSYRTEETYVQWIRRYILFHNKRHPKEMGTPEIEAFLTHLAIDGQVAASTQNQALSAIFFLYRHVLQQELDSRIDAICAKRPTRLPVVLSSEEARAIIHLNMQQSIPSSPYFNSAKISFAARSHTPTDPSPLRTSS